MLKLDVAGIRYRLGLAKQVVTSQEIAQAGRNWARIYSRDVRALRAAYNRARGLLRGTDNQLLDILRQMEEAPSFSNAAVLADRRLRSILGLPKEGPLPKRLPGYPGL